MKSVYTCSEMATGGHDPNDWKKRKSVGNDPDFMAEQIIVAGLREQHISQQ